MYADNIEKVLTFALHQVNIRNTKENCKLIVIFINMITIYTQQRRKNGKNSETIICIFVHADRRGCLECA